MNVMIHLVWRFLVFQSSFWRPVLEMSSSVIREDGRKLEERHDDTSHRYVVTFDIISPTIVEQSRTS